MGTVACTCCASRKDDKALADQLLNSPSNMSKRYLKKDRRSKSEKVITAIKFDEETDLRTQEATTDND